MKVLFVSSGNSRYGISPIIQRQGESLIARGIDIHYFTIKGKGLSGYIKSIPKLRKYIKDGGYDFVHAHYGLVGLLCVIAAPNKPIILSVMGDDAYGSFNSQGKRLISSYFQMLITQIALIFVNQIIVKSKNILKVIFYKFKSQVIPNGVNFDIFRPNSENLCKNSILFLADPKDPRKNINLIKKAVELIDNKDLKLTNPFPIEHHKFPEFLNNTSVFVLTSYNEGSPNVIKEAMACNIPIVSTDVGDVKEVIGNTEGCYITSFDPEDVADKIKKAIDFGKRTKGRVDIKHLEASVIAKKIIDVYNKVLEK